MIKTQRLWRELTFHALSSSCWQMQMIWVFMIYYIGCLFYLRVYGWWKEFVHLCSLDGPQDDAVLYSLHHFFHCFCLHVGCRCCLLKSNEVDEILNSFETFVAESSLPWCLWSKRTLNWVQPRQHFELHSSFIWIRFGHCTFLWKHGYVQICSGHTLYNAYHTIVTSCIWVDFHDRRQKGCWWRKQRQRPSERPLFESCLNAFVWIFLARRWGFLYLWQNEVF